MHPNQPESPSPIVPFGDTFTIAIPMEDPIIHTPDRPFCYGDPSCPCHRDPELLARVHRAVEEGLLTQEEATFFMQGKTI